MYFFEQQDRSRSTTRFLLCLFVLAILLTVVIVYFGLLIALNLQPQTKAELLGYAWNWRLFAQVFAAVGSFILLLSVYKTWQLAYGGGKAVAENLGGRRIYAASEDIAERRLLNIVQEMALASGVAVPPVYVLEEELSINAFAARVDEQHAVIALTKGALQKLDRAELQAVVAHEFSHIFNGDMRINMKLMGLLFGFTGIYLIGRFIVRFTRSERGKQNKAVLLGVGLVIAGLLGLLIGNIIRAAVTRQREFLADASAVQYTRNPLALNSALKKIARDIHLMDHPGAEAAAHMFFHNSFSSIFASHPPIKERIKRIRHNIAAAPD